MAHSSQVLLALLSLAMAIGHSSGSWCVCKEGLSDTVLQKTLDYACGAGADCSPIRPNGPCYNPTSVKAHCSYAVNSYFQKRNQVGGTCDFGGAATVTSSNPSSSGCTYPASTSGSTSSGTTPVVSVPSTTPTTPTTSPVTVGNPTVSSGTPTTSSPYTTTVPRTGSPTTAATSSSYPNGLGSSMGPTGVGMNDNSHAGRIMILQIAIASFCCLIVASMLLI